MRTIRLFVSSPTDVDFERRRIDRAVRAINAEYAAVLKIETIRWETAFYRAHRTFVQQIPQAADCDIVVCIFWARLGTPLPDEAEKMPDGEPYESGTAYELLTALEAARTRDRPEVYIFQKTMPPVQRLDKPEELVEAQSQWRRLQSFLERWFADSSGRITKPIYPFGTTDEFESKVTDLLRQWIKANVREAGERWSVELRGSPFRGLAPFDAKHAEVFCGRDRKVGRAIDELVHAVDRGKPFLLIVGPSGAGKSSLMRAGLMPRLTNAGAISQVDIWRTAVMRPSDGESPFLSLARALFTQGGADDPGGFGAALPELAEGEFTDPVALAPVLEADGVKAAQAIHAALDSIAAREAARGGYQRALQPRLLLLVDQLEDVFTTGISREARAAFARLLHELLTGQRIWIVATLRADVYDRMIADRPFIALKDRGGHYDLAPPGREELEEIIVKSAEVAGLTYETDPRTGETLDARLLADTEGEDILPLLEFTLNQLFERRETVDGHPCLTFSAYETIGGLGGVIDQAGEAALTQLSAEDVAALPRLVRSLVVPIQTEGGGTSERSLTIRATPLSDAVTDERSQRLADALVKARVLLLTRQKDAAAAVLRIAHQRVLECWKRVRAVIEAERTFFRVRDEVENQCRRWQAAGSRNELLVPPGRPLAEANELVAAYGSELSPGLRSFIAASHRRATLRQRIVQGAALAFALIAVFASWEGLRARSESERANTSYSAARGTIDELIQRFARGMSQTDGIPLSAIQSALDAVKDLVGKLQRQSGGDTKLTGTQAAMYYQFASVYHDADYAPQASAAAATSLGMWRNLVRQEPQEPQWRWKLALSLDQVGDLLRLPRDAKASAPDPRSDACGTARDCYRQAQAIRKALAALEPSNLQYVCGLSLSGSRLGDVEAQHKNFIMAKSYYDAEFGAARTILAKNKSAAIADCPWPRELFWSYNKEGTAALALKQYPLALDAYKKELCVHLHVAAGKPDDLLAQRDLAWSLDNRLAKAEDEKGDSAQAETDLFAALSIREQLQAADTGRIRWTSELADALARAGAFEAKRNNTALALALAMEEIKQRKRVAASHPVDSKTRKSGKRADKAADALDIALHQELALEQLAGPDETKRVAQDGRQMIADQERRSDPALDDYRDGAAACWKNLVAHPGISAAGQ